MSADARQRPPELEETANRDPLWTQSSDPVGTTECARCGKAFALGEAVTVFTNGAEVCGPCCMVLRRLLDWYRGAWLTLLVAYGFLVAGVCGSWYTSPVPHSVEWSWVLRMAYTAGAGFSVVALLQGWRWWPSAAFSPATLPNPRAKAVGAGWRDR